MLIQTITPSLLVCCTGIVILVLNSNSNSCDKHPCEAQNIPNIHDDGRHHVMFTCLRHALLTYDFFASKASTMNFLRAILLNAGGTWGSAAEGHLGEGLLEEVAGALQLAAAVALHKLLQVGQPDVAHVRVLEQRHAPLIHPE